MVICPVFKITILSINCFSTPEQKEIPNSKIKLPKKIEMPVNIERLLCLNKFRKAILINPNIKSVIITPIICITSLNPCLQGFYRLQFHNITGGEKSGDNAENINHNKRQQKNINFCR